MVVAVVGTLVPHPAPQPDRSMSSASASPSAFLWPMLGVQVYGSLPVIRGVFRSLHLLFETVRHEEPSDNGFPWTMLIALGCLAHVLPIVTVTGYSACFGHASRRRLRRAPREGSRRSCPPPCAFPCSSKDIDEGRLRMLATVLYCIVPTVACLLVDLAFRRYLLQTPSECRVPKGGDEVFPPLLGAALRRIPFTRDSNHTVLSHPEQLWQAPSYVKREGRRERERERERERDYTALPVVCPPPVECAKCSSCTCM